MNQQQQPSIRSNAWQQFVSAIQSRSDTTSRRITPISFLQEFVTALNERFSIRESIFEEKKSREGDQGQTAYLKTLIFSENSQHPDSKTCGICYGDFRAAQHIVQTTCCGTKFMHLNCSLQCLRRSEICPFCKSCKIGFFE